MKRYLFSTILAIALLAPSLAVAHDASLHKGKATVGEVVSIAAGKMELKTATGPVTVTLNEKTKYEHGDQTVDVSHVAKGQKVSVFGTKLPTGELVAREILIGAADSHAAHK
jgi:hypothetical protein